MSTIFIFIFFYFYNSKSYKNENNNKLIKLLKKNYMKKYLMNTPTQANCEITFIIHISFFKLILDEKY